MASIISEIPIGERVHLTGGGYAIRLDIEEFDHRTQRKCDDIEDGMLPFAAHYPNGFSEYILLPSDGSITKCDNIPQVFREAFE